MKKLVEILSRRLLHHIMVIFLILFLIDHIIPAHTTAQDFVNINSSKTYQVNNYVRVTNTAGTLTKVVIMMPLPQSNTYQKINAINTSSGTILDIPDTEDRYLRYTITEDLPHPGETRTLGYNFNVTLHNITIDLDVPEILYDYDINSDIYRSYTAASGVIVDPLNPDIKAIADPIWDNSPDIIYFAERCYEYVAQNFQYLNP